MVNTIILFNDSNNCCTDDCNVSPTTPCWYLPACIPTAVWHQFARVLLRIFQYMFWGPFLIFFAKQCPSRLSAACAMPFSAVYPFLRFVDSQFNFYVYKLVFFYKPVYLLSIVSWSLPFFCCLLSQEEAVTLQSNKY